MSFTGEFHHTIDAKGRLIVPSRMRDELTAGQVVLTRWLENCIALWSAEGWADIEKRLTEQGSSDKAARRFNRLVAASAHPDEVDKQGRITVPQHLRDLAGVARDVVVTGALTHGEIWNPDRWEQQKTEGDRFEELAQELNF